MLRILSIEFLLRSHRQAETGVEMLAATARDSHATGKRYLTLEVLVGQPDHALARDLVRLQSNIPPLFERDRDCTNDALDAGSLSAIDQDADDCARRIHDGGRL
jgi:hypothetical protein